MKYGGIGFKTRAVCVFKLFLWYQVVTLIFDFWSWKSIGFLLLPWPINIQSWMKTIASPDHYHAWRFFYDTLQWPWPLNMNFNRPQVLIMINHCTKFDKDRLQDLAFLCQKGFSVNYCFDRDLWSSNLKISRLQTLIMTGLFKNLSKQAVFCDEWRTIKKAEPMPGSFLPYCPVRFSTSSYKRTP